MTQNLTGIAVLAASAVLADSFDLLKRKVAAGAGAITIKRPRAAQAQRSPAEPPGRKGYAYLTPDEAAFAKALVDHMVLAGTAAGNGTEVGPNFYIDAALAANLGNGDAPPMRRPRDTDAAGRAGVSGTALYRVGMAATDIYCKRIFGELFDGISDEQRKGVLRLLDSIKLVFQDGSGAGVFFAIVCQTVRRSRR